MDFKDWVKFSSIKEKYEKKEKNEITQEELNQYFLDNIKVSDYITLNTKRIMTDFFFLKIEDSQEDFVQLSYQFELFSIMIILILYTNIELEEDDVIPESYDIIIESKLYDYIKFYCEEDFIRFVNMAERAIQFKTTKIIDEFGALDENTLDNGINKLKELFGEMKQEDLTLMKDIVSFNDPALLNLKNKIYESINIEHLKEIDKKQG